MEKQIVKDKYLNLFVYYVNMAMGDKKSPIDLVAKKLNPVFDFPDPRREKQPMAILCFEIQKQHNYSNEELFNLIVFSRLCWNPETIEYITYLCRPSIENLENGKFEQACIDTKKKKNKFWSNSYMPPGCTNFSDLCNVLKELFYEVFKKDLSAEEAYMTINSKKGLGQFYSNLLVSDIHFCVKEFREFDKYFPKPGSGAIEGYKKITGKKYDKESFARSILEVQDKLKELNMDLHYTQIEDEYCEFNKYLREFEKVSKKSQERIIDNIYFLK